MTGKTGPAANQIFINLSDQSGLAPSTAQAYIAGWINGGSDDFAILGADGTFGSATVQSFTVSATQPWQRTGIMITEGGTATYTVAFQSGSWTADPATNNGQLYGAQGCPGVIVPTDRTLFPIVGVPMGALVGRVGGGAPFLVGNGPWIVPNGASGELELCINDDLTGAYGSGLTDNSGSITVAIARGMGFHLMSSIPTITLETATNGNERLIVVVAPSQPLEIPVFQQSPMQYTAYPYAGMPPAALFPPGPFDVFEFGFDAAADLTAVNGFGLNLSFSYGTENYGVTPSIDRSAIAAAYTAFIDTETKALPAAAAFKPLLYTKALDTGAPVPPAIGGQFLAICDPNDWLSARTGNYANTTDDPLATFWDDTLTSFFTVGKYVSINLSANPSAPNIYSGTCTQQTNPMTNVASPAYTLSNGTNSYTFYMPLAAGASKPGLVGAQYVFQQAFGPLTPAGNGGDAGSLQDSIWEALCRGVATEGAFDTSKTNGESTTAWNDSTKWYKSGVASHLYAKFLHCGTVGGTPLMQGGAAYGYSMDETPLGPYSGPNVPSKTLENVPGGSTMNLVLGPWAKAS